MSAVPRAVGRPGMRKALRGHPRRFVAAALASALGVAFVAASIMLVGSAKQGIEDAVAGRYAATDVVVGLTGEPAQGGRAAEAVEALAGVASVSPLASTYGELSWDAHPRPVGAAVDVLADDPEVRWQQVVSGVLPAAAGEIALDDEEAEATGLGVGSSVTFTGYDGSTTALTVVGVVEPSALATDAPYVMTLAGARAVDAELWTAELLVRADVGTDASVLAATVAEVVGDAGTVATSAEQVATIVADLTGDVDVLGILLLGFAVVALVVAAIVVANTFTIVLAQRTRELALLRCVGAGRGQVFRSVVGQAVLLGLVSGGVGVVGGLGLASGVAALARAQAPFPLGGVSLSAFAVLVPVVAGLVVTVASALVPGYRATTVAPVAALQPVQVSPTRSRAGALRVVAAAGAIAIGGLVMAVGAQGSSLPLGLLGGTVSFLGVLLLGPVLMPALVRLVGALPARTGLPARLARLDAVRNPGRTAATCSALLVGVTLISTMTVGSASMEKSVVQAVDHQLPVDLLVAAGGSALPAGAVGSVAEVEGVISVAGLRSASSDADGAPVTLLGVDPDAGRKATHGTMLDELRDGVVLVPYGWVGEREVRDGSTLRVGGIELEAQAYEGLPDDDLLVTNGDLDRIDDAAPLTAVWAAVADGTSPKDVLRATEAAVSDVPGIEVEGGLVQRADYQSIFEVMLLVATGLLGVAVLIALVGVGNTLSLSVLERTREHGLLRALGLTRQQLRVMLGTEAVLMAVAAAVLGVGLGIAYGVAGTMTVLGGATDQVAFAVPWQRLVVIGLVAALAGLVAAVLPARRAARTSPVAALGVD